MEILPHFFAARTIWSRVCIFAIMCWPLLLNAAPDSRPGDVAPTAQSETYGDWVIQCANMEISTEGGLPATKKRICQVSQSLAQGNSNQRVLTLVLESSAKNKQPLMGTVIAPFGVDLPSGLSLRIKGEVYSKAAYKTCLPQGCVATVAVDSKFEAALRANEKLTVTLIMSNGTSVDLDVSLKGLNESLDRLKSIGG